MFTVTAQHYLIVYVWWCWWYRIPVMVERLRCLMSPYCIIAGSGYRVTSVRRERELGGSRAVAAAGLRRDREGTIGAIGAIGPPDTPAPRVREPGPATTDISSTAGELVVGLSLDTCRDTLDHQAGRQGHSVIMITPIHQLSI